MRGKKVDMEFVSTFIAQCAGKGKVSPEDICKEAELKIQNIDEKIKEVELLKKTRSKLSDVVITLGKKEIDHSQDKLLLTFYNISNLTQAYQICSLLQHQSIEIKKTDVSQATLYKEMLIANVIKREALYFVKGEMLQEFMKFYKEKGLQ